MSPAEHIEELLDQGYEALDDHDLETALKTGRRLEQAGHTAGFEIQALAHSANGDLDESVKALERGLEKAPDVWPLWQLLGSTHSDAERYDEAFAAYDRALACPDVDAESVHFNFGTVLLREGRDEEALARLAHIGALEQDEPLRLLVTSARMSALNNLGRHEEAARLGEVDLTSLGEDEAPPLIASLHAELGRAFAASEDTRPRALAHARGAIEIHKHCEEAKALVRELEGRTSEDAKYFHLNLQGDWPEPGPEGEAIAFHVDYTVVADSETEAVAFASSFEPEELRASLKLRESEVVSESTDAPTGVYETSGYVFFPRDGG